MRDCYLGSQQSQLCAIQSSIEHGTEVDSEICVRGTGYERGDVGEGGVESWDRSVVEIVTGRYALDLVKRRVAGSYDCHGSAGESTAVHSGKVAELSPRLSLVPLMVLQ